MKKILSILLLMLSILSFKTLKATPTNTTIRFDLNNYYNLREDDFLGVYNILKGHHNISIVSVIDGNNMNYSWQITYISKTDNYVEVFLSGSQLTGNTHIKFNNDGTYVLTSESSIQSLRNFAIEIQSEQDTGNPVINGETNYITNVDNPVSEETIKSGLSAYDDYDGPIPSTSFILIQDDYSAYKHTLGIYDIRYVVADTSGNEAYVTVKVHVVDVVKPTISGKNSYVTPHNVILSEAFVRSQLTANDNYDTDVSITLVNDGYTSNYQTLGTYKIRYQATDTSNNTSDIFEVSVTVVDTVPPIIYTNDAFINVDGNLNYSIEQIIQHLINIGQLSNTVNMVNYQIRYSNYISYEPGEYQIILEKYEDAPDELSNRVVIGVKVFPTSSGNITPEPIKATMTPIIIIVLVSIAVLILTRNKTTTKKRKVRYKK